MQAFQKAEKFPSPEVQGTHFAMAMMGPYVTKILNELMVINGYRGIDQIKDHVYCDFKFFIPNSAMNDSAKRFFSDMVKNVKVARADLEVRTLRKILGDEFHG